jgi:glycosyltransferase involved in cell wall biosynthesis
MGACDVSVAMITYNHERFIDQAIGSVLQQETDFRVEIVIGEDCSTDRTRAIVTSYGERYPDRVRLVLHEQNVGMQRNMASTVKSCTGKYVALLEGDDYWTSGNKLQSQFEFLESHFDYSACAHNAIKYDEQTGRATGKYNSAIEPEVITLRDMLKWDAVPTCSVFFRNGLIGEFPEWFFTLAMGDWPIHVLNARHGKMHFDPATMACYRIHAGGVWSGAHRLIQLQGLIKARLAFDREFKGEYRNLTQRMIAQHYFEMAQIEEKAGHLRAARAAFINSLRSTTFGSGLHVRDLVKLTAKLFASPSYRLARWAGWVERGQHDMGDRGGLTSEM